METLQSIFGKVSVVWNKANELTTNHPALSVAVNLALIVLLILSLIRV